MIKKIKYYETISQMEMNRNTEFLAKVLFDFKYMKVKKTDNQNIASEVYFDRTMSIDGNTGFIHFEDEDRLNNPDAIRNELPENKEEARANCFDFFRKKDKELQNEHFFKKTKFPPLFLHLHFVNAYPVDIPTISGRFIDHWECFFDVHLYLDGKNRNKAVLKNASVIVKVGNKGKIIGFNYQYLPVTRSKLVENIEEKKCAAIIKGYQMKINHFEEKEIEILNNLYDIESLMQKNNMFDNEKLKNKFNSLKKMVYKDTDLGLSLEHIKYSLDNESRQFKEDIEKIDIQNLVYYYDPVTNLITPWYVSENKKYLPASKMSNHQREYPTDVPEKFKSILFPDNITVGIMKKATANERNQKWSITEYIKKIEEIENKFSEEEQRNTKLMITRFRKIYYDSAGWNNVLIPNTSDIPCIFSEEEYKLNFKQGNEVIIDLSGYLLDIGHVIAALDAFNHLSSIDIFMGAVFWVDIKRNIDAATWLGDLGSVIAHMRREFFNKLYWNEFINNDIIIDLLIKIFKEKSSSIDLLSDIDGIVIANHLPISANKNGKKMSELLRDYYLQENSCVLISNRISLFAKEIGLGENFENEEAFIKRYQHEITDAALIYLINTYGGNNFIGKGFYTLSNSKNKLDGDLFLNMKYGTYILQIFSNSLKKCVY